LIIAGAALSLIAITVAILPNDEATARQCNSDNNKNDNNDQNNNSNDDSTTCDNHQQHFNNHHDSTTKDKSPFVLSMPFP
jgi:hypothetical protein